MAAVIFSVGNAIRRQFDFKKEKIRETPFSFFFFFFGSLVKFNLYALYNLSRPFFSDWKSKCGGRKGLTCFTTSETIQLGTRLAFAGGGPFNINLISFGSDTFFFELLIDMTHSPPLLSNGEHYRDGPAGAAGDFFLFSLPTPPCGPRFVTQCGC